MGHRTHIPFCGYFASSHEQTQQEISKLEKDNRGPLRSKAHSICLCNVFEKPASETKENPDVGPVLLKTSKKNIPKTFRSEHHRAFNLAQFIKRKQIGSTFAFAEH